ncbi:hypothetical protein ABPG72_003051 [Tetrahymena utriculariae]
MGEKQSKNKSIHNSKDEQKNQPQSYQRSPEEVNLDIILIHDSQKQQKITIKSYSEIDKIDSSQAISLIIDQPKSSSIVSFSEQNMIQLCKLLEKSKKLISLRLNLFSWRVGNIGLIKLADTFSLLQNMTKLDLNYQYNSVYQDGTLGLAQALSKCNNIQSLNLALGQCIDDETLFQLGKALSGLFNLKILILDFGEHPTIDIVIFEGDVITQIQDEGFKRFFQCLKQCQEINYVQLYFDFMVKYKKLTYFNIDSFENNKYFKRYQWS